MVSIFWDVHGVNFIDYLEKGKRITGAYYAALLDRLVHEIRKKLKRWLCGRRFESNEEVEWETEGYFVGF